MIGEELRSQPVGLHTSGQTPKVKGLYSTYMAILFGIFDAKSLSPSRTGPTRVWVLQERKPKL